MASLLSILVAACILGVCALLGTRVLALARLLGKEGRNLPPPERLLFGLAAGMLVLALAVLGIGLLGLLRPWVVWVAVGLCAIGGLPGGPLIAESFQVAAGFVRREVLSASPQRALYLFLAVWGVLTLLCALAPPTDIDYDGLSQHLAAPKVYLRHGRIHPLWYDHHSQFPSTLQMLYLLALAAGSPEAAKMLHWSCAALTAVTLIVIGRRFLSAAAGGWAAFSLVVTPLIGWLSGVAYVDLASAFFSALLLLAFLRWVSDRNAAPTARLQSPLNVSLLGLAAGGGMAVKMQGLQLFGALVVLVAIACIRAREPVLRIAREAGLVLLVAALPSAPWYVKSLVWTGNPVYPFMYRVFGGKYWGPAEAAQYRTHQLGFGIGEPPSAAEAQGMGFFRRTFSGPRALPNLLLAPWNLTMRPAEFDVVNINPLYAVMSGGVGPLFLAVLPLLFCTGAPWPIRWSLALFALLWMAWLMLMQYNRYLVPALPFAALPAGYVLGMGLPRGLPRWVGRTVAWSCGAVALTYLTAYGLLTGAWAAAVGLMPRELYLRTNSECFRVSDWINQVTPRSSRVALYAEPRGFYLDREYLWADPGHSRLIEYEAIRSPDDLLAIYARLGVTHVLYRRLPGAAELFDTPPYGKALAQLEREGRVYIVGRPPADPDYLLLALRMPRNMERRR